MHLSNGLLDLLFFVGVRFFIWLWLIFLKSLELFITGFCFCLIRFVLFLINNYVPKIGMWVSSLYAPFSGVCVFMEGMFRSMFEFETDSKLDTLLGFDLLQHFVICFVHWIFIATLI